MERLTERRDAQWVIPLRNDGKHKWALCKAGMSLDDSSEYLYGDHANRLAAYEDTGLGPEEITTEPYGCVFYCNRKCNLDGDFCAEGPGCPREIDAGTAKHLLELAKAEKEGRLVVLPCKPGDDLIRNGLVFKGDHWNVLLTAFADDASAPFGKRVKLFSTEEAEAVLKNMEDEQREN